MSTFDISAEKALVDAGTHFFCKCCVTARPIEERAEIEGEPIYCKACAAILQESKDVGGSAPNKPEAVSKITNKGNERVTIPQSRDKSNFETRKRRGRPVKIGAISRTTAWRRRKQLT